MIIDPAGPSLDLKITFRQIPFCNVKKKASNKNTPPPKALLFLGLKMKVSKRQAADDIQLIPFDGFKTTVKKVLSVSKAESDKELAEFQASNLKKREAKKRH